MKKKKPLIIFVLRLLEAQTDKRNPLTQTKMANIISVKHPCDRKTVCRNVKFLKEMGYPIVKTAKGFYMDNKTFSVEEIEFVKSAILNATTDRTEEIAELADRVSDILTKRYMKLN